MGSKQLYRVGNEIIRSETLPSTYYILSVESNISFTLRVTRIINSFKVLNSFQFPISNLK